MKIKKANEALALSSIGRINVFYGYTGSGKSSLALTATKTKKVIYVDVENTVGKIWNAIPDNNKNINNLHTANVESIQELIEFINGDEIKEYDLLVIDSITFLAEQELGTKTDLGRKLSFHDYGDLGLSIKQVLRRAQMRGLNIIILMQAEQIETDNGDIVYFPRSAGKQITPAVVERADNIFYIQERNGKRTAHTSRTKEWHAKRRDQLPDTIDTEDLTFEHIESFFAKHEATIGNPKELMQIIADANVQNVPKLYHYIGWDGKGKIYQHQIEEARALLAKQIEANKLQKNESNTDSE